ncbi:MAG: cytochrome c oxidase subunit 3 [Lewinellaceae bacterium]|nr:cytochrome c oxidase subunit 3 [Saprospiraceae bacterium]MCB9336512.1 cytochrome c oxidase subunit 3 [Lewinellaceae bacterium]
MAEVVLEHAADQDEHLWEGGKEPFKASYGKLMMWYFLLSDAFTFAGFLISYGALRFSSPTWPVPDVVFEKVPFFPELKAPLVFVTFMTFVLIASSVTMVRAVQEGHRENKNGVVIWMFLTILGGATFLGCQAWEWTTLIAKEHVSLSQNPFGTHTEAGVYLEDDHGHALPAGEQVAFRAGDGYLIHKDHESGEWLQRKYRTESGVEAKLDFGPRAFGALFFFITGFHGFHVFSGVVFLTIIMLNAASGVYVRRHNGYEMVEKIGLYWHFVDLVWVFVFLVFYLL